MNKNIFKNDPINVLDLAYNDRYLYKEICELKQNIKKNRKQFEKEKRKFNQIFGMTVKKQNDYIPIGRLDLMIKKLREKGIISTDLEEKKKIQYTLGILYQLFFYMKGEENERKSI